MKSKKPESQRVARKPDVPCKDIVHSLRQQILDFKLNPGDRLPSNALLQRQFRTTPVTVHRAVQCLVADGYLRTKNRVGIFVAEHPPHVSHFAILFPWSLVHTPSQFYRAIQKEAGKLQQPNRHVSPFYGVMDDSGGADYSRLLQSVDAHQLAGLIFAFSPWARLLSSLAQGAGLPRVGIMMADPKAGFPTVYPDLVGWQKRAFERLAALGRKRVAILMLGSECGTDKVVARLQQEARRYGLAIQPAWVQAVHLDAAAWAAQVTQLLLLPKAPEQRPDGLLIMDDNLVAPATAGVAASGLKVPRELTIIAQTNFPWPTPSAVPVTRLGFDITRLVATCLEQIEALRNGEMPISHTAIPAVFEEEIHA